MSERPVYGKYDLLQCPYDLTHQIDSYRFQIHLMKCARNHPEMNMFICPFNSTHHVPMVQKQHHISTCPDQVLLAKPSKQELKLNNPENEYFHGDISVPAYNNPWDKADYREDWELERDPYSAAFDLQEVEKGSATEPIHPRHSDFSNQQLRRPKEASRAAYNQPQPQVGNIAGVGRGRARPFVANGGGAEVSMNGVNDVNTQVLQSMAVGTGIGRGIPVESFGPIGRGSVPAATVNSPNFSLGGRGRPVQPAALAPVVTNGFHTSNSYGSGLSTSPSSGDDFTANPIRQAPIGTPRGGNPMNGDTGAQRPAARATNVPGFSLKKANVSNFKPAPAPAPALAAPPPASESGSFNTVAHGTGSATNFFLGNPGVGRGAVLQNRASEPSFVVPNLNRRTQAVAPPPGFGGNTNANNSSSSSSSSRPPVEKDAFQDYESQPAPGSYQNKPGSGLPGIYGSYGGGYIPAGVAPGLYAGSRTGSTPSLTDSTGSESLQDVDTEDDEETRKQKEMRKVQKKLRDIEALEWKKRQGKPLNADQKDKLSKKAELQDLLVSLRLN